MVTDDASGAARILVLIRSLNANDFPALRALDDAVARLTPDSFAAYVRDGCSVVAVLDGRPVGYLLARPLAYLDERPLSVWVDGVAVHPERQQHGVATALYRGFGDWARTQGIRAALTRVDVDDLVAQALHKSVGFEPHATDSLIWRFDGA